MLNSLAVRIHLSRLDTAHENIKASNILSYYVLFLDPSYYIRNLKV